MLQLKSKVMLIVIVDWRSTPTTHMVPPSGLDFLRGVTDLYIQQTVELVDSKLLSFCIFVL